jgi:hypothetical protein
MIVNIERNCDERLSPNLECYKNDPLTKQLADGTIGRQLELGSSARWKNILHYSGWEELALPSVRDSTRTKSSWWAYTLIAPK